MSTIPHLEPIESVAQIEDVVRLARETWQEHYVGIVGQDQVDYMLEKFQSERAIAEQISTGYEYFMIVHEDKNAGYVAVIPNTDNATLMISKIYVSKSARANGLGAIALDYVEELCRKRGLGVIWLTVNKNNTDSIAWYLRRGFVNTRSVVMDIGGGFVMDDFRMEKQRKSPS
jgi:ribosomal protein S18 acetylase RimI-like enzyme